MTTNPEHFRPRDAANSSGGQQYLESTVRNASPARLRLMLIQRSIEVCHTLANTWREGQASGGNEHSLKLLDLLSELLSGVTGGNTETENEICSAVADLYVFLLKHLVIAEESSDANMVDEIRIVLETENDTWQAVCANENSGAALPLSDATTIAMTGINLEA